jgi:DNA-binding SARP family transcriptional activator
MNELLPPSIPEKQSEAYAQELIDRAIECEFKNPTEAFRLATEALAIAESIEHQRLIAKAQLYCGIALNRLSNFPLSLQSFEKALLGFIDLNLLKETAGTMIGIGGTLHRLGKYSDALRYLSQALVLFEKMENQLGISRVSGNMGCVHFRLGNYPTAISYHLKELAIGEALTDLSAQENALNNLAIALSYSGNPSSGLEYAMRGLALVKQTQNHYVHGAILGTIAHCYTALKEPTRAIRFYLESIALAKSVGDLREAHESLMNLGNIFFDVEQYEDAERMFVDSYDVAKTIGDETTAMRAQLNLDRLRYRLHTLSADEARSRLIAHLAAAETLGDRFLEKSILELLVEVLKNRDDKAEAALYHEKYESLKNDLTGEATTQKINALLVERESEQMLAQLREIGIETSNDKLFLAIKKYALPSPLVLRPEDQSFSAEQHQESLKFESDDAIVEALLATSKNQTDKYAALKSLQEAKTLAEKNQNARLIALVKLELGKKMRLFGEPTTAKDLLREALTYFERSNEQEQLATCLTELAQVLRVQNDLLNALDYADKALALLEAEPLNDIKAQALFIKAGVLYDTGNTLESLRLSNELLAFTRHYLPEKEPLVLKSMGNAFRAEGVFDKALDYYFACLRLQKLSNDTVGEAGCYNNIGLIYEDLNAFDMALTYHLKSFALREQLNRKTDIAASLLNIGLVYLRLEEYPSALKHLLKALPLAVGQGNVLIEMLSMLHLGECYDRLAMDDEAKEHFKHALHLAKTHAFPRETAMTCEIFGEFYRQREQLNNAMALYQQGLDAIEKTGFASLQLSLHKKIAEAAQVLGQQDLFRLHQRRAAELKAELDSPVMRQNVRALAIEIEIDNLRSDALANGLTPEESESIIKALEKSTKRKTEKLMSSVPERTAITVKTLGEFHLSVDKREVAAAEWGLKKSRDVFKILLLRHQTAVAADELIELIWGDAALKNKNAKAGLQNAISFIRKALEPELDARQPSRFLSAKDQTYTLNLGEAHIDFIQFKSRIAAAKKTLARQEQLALYREAINLYTGDFLKENLYDEWSSFERESLREMYLSALLTLGEDEREKKNYDAALLFGDQLLATDRTYEPAYRLLIHCALDKDDRAQAERVFRKAHDVYKKEFSAPPPKSLLELMKS